MADILTAMGARVVFNSKGVTVAPPEGGSLRGIDVDMSACPDLTPTVAVLAALAKGRTRIFGAAHLRLKESDRISAPAQELRKLGCVIDEQPDGMIITPPDKLSAADGEIFCTHNDHRLAMSLTLLARRGLIVNLDNPACVDKSFPDFFKVWQQLMKTRD
jgi:3-phosphoshikimate 1-carboxyvinyltransferase